MDSVEASHDNALAETICKAEIIHRRGPWRNFDTVQYATLEWIAWFTNRRPLDLSGNILPEGAAANDHAALETRSMAV
ncbi:hypothetical protein [Roseovarius pacificus]|uniref:hypothetical protein n=1 Tax=Roseovarius pacificus TaxID=337701 RepID=UPI003749F03D